MLCRVCSGPVDLFAVKSGYEVMQCARCGFGQVDVSPADIAAFYDKAYFDGEKADFGQEEEAELRPSHRFWIEQQLAHWPAREPLSVLEIGPGLGGPLAGYFLRERPEVTFTAIEISEYASERLRSRGMTVYAGRVVDAEILDACRGRFDLVYGTEVIEHDLDPHGFARSVHEMLKPGGRAAFTTGNLRGWMARWNRERWYYLDPPAHVSFYTPEAARLLFAAEGFGEVDVTRYGFNHITARLRTHIPGLLWMTDVANVSTGMTISATRSNV